MGTESIKNTRLSFEHRVSSSSLSKTDLNNKKKMIRKKKMEKDNNKKKEEKEEEKVNLTADTLFTTEGALGHNTTESNSSHLLKGRKRGNEIVVTKWKNKRKLH